jgi:hypothetical protein
LIPEFRQPLLPVERLLTRPLAATADLGRLVAMLADKVAHLRLQRLIRFRQRKLRGFLLFV